MTRFLVLLTLYVSALVAATVFAFTQSADALASGLFFLCVWVYAVAPGPKYRPKHLRTD